MGTQRAVVLPDGTTLTYLIDGQQRRIGKWVNGVLVQGCLSQDQLRPIAELDGTGQVTARFVYADHTNVQAYLEKGGRTYRIFADHLGSPRLVIDTASPRDLCLLRPDGTPWLVSIAQEQASYLVLSAEEKHTSLQQYRNSGPHEHASALKRLTVGAPPS